MARGGNPGRYFGPGAGPGPFHHYVFEFYALDTKLDLPATATRDDLHEGDGRARHRQGRVHRPLPRARRSRRAAPMWQPNRPQWAIIWAAAIVLVLGWPPEQGRSLVVKAVNWAVDPAGTLPALPPPLPMGLDDDGDAVAAHDAQEAEYYRAARQSRADALADATEGDGRAARSGRPSGSCWWASAC